MTEVLVDAYLAALKSMGGDSPKPLARRASFMAEDIDPTVDVSPARLVAHLADADANDSLMRHLGLAIFDWDGRPTTEDWTAQTGSRSHERRLRTYELLGLTKEMIESIDKHFPLIRDRSTIISSTFEPWYPPAGLDSRAFYWDRYRAHLLEAKGWELQSVASLDEDTRQVLERMSNPARVEAFPARGLVVGYVQSGKTANFTGVIAKAIDAGYRLIIVLAGTLDILREQTQRRLDMELVGRQNILQDWDEDDPDLEPHDYADDSDWVAKKFLDFGFRPSERDFPNIIRLTGRKYDYRKLGQGIVALDMEKRDKMKPLYDPANLYTCGARLAVVKKNGPVLRRLVGDLKKVRRQLGEIPTLIIDDESDQASVNTTDPRKWKEGKVQRTSINGLLSELLGLLPRAQYVGYTATPYANVFVDPEDAEDIFPKDFLLALSKPNGYMGVADFHDLDSMIQPQDRNVMNSNEEAFVRNLRGDSVDKRRLELAAAIDAFVLSGAIKLYREEAWGREGKFRHHTMLINESHKKEDHAETAEIVRELWQEAGYVSGHGYERLRDLFESDFLPVCRARGEGAPFPTDFDELRGALGRAIRKIWGSGSPVIIVNSDQDLSQEAIDFDKRSVWRVLVGGTKLSRGFTVEGLTVSYYRRRTRQAATMMQMGRWFGFRSGYKDLVRLYIGRQEQDRTMRLDLYKAFEAMVRDEEDFRGELERYSELVDGMPQVTPQDIPPLVSQRVPWLKPEAANKMYNAELVIRRSPGVRIEPRAYPEAARDVAANYELMLPTLTTADKFVTFKSSPKATFDAFAGVTTHDELLDALRRLRWMTPDYFKPDLKFLEEAGEKGLIRDWLIIVPLRQDHRDTVVELPGVGRRNVFARTRQEGKSFGAISEPRHREPAKFIAGADITDVGDPIIEAYAAPNRGAVILYPVVTDEPYVVLDDALDPGHVNMCFELTAPVSSCPPGSRLVQFRVRNPALKDRAIVPVAK